jgi:hypothetical protein
MTELMTSTEVQIKKKRQSETQPSLLQKQPSGAVGSVMTKFITVHRTNADDPSDEGERWRSRRAFRTSDNPSADYLYGRELTKAMKRVVSLTQTLLAWWIAGAELNTSKRLQGRA